MIKPRYTLDEIARLGDAAYDREVAPRAGADHELQIPDGLVEITPITKRAA